MAKDFMDFVSIDGIILKVGLHGCKIKISLK